MQMWQLSICEFLGGFWEDLGKWTYLQEVSDVSIGSFRVWPWNFKQGALLTNNKNVHKLSDVVAMSGSYNQEICLWHLVQVDWGTEEVILKRLWRN